MSFVTRMRAVVARAWPVGGTAGLPWLGDRIAVGGASLPTLTPQGALALTSVWKACTLLSDAVCTERPTLYRSPPNGGRQTITNSAAARALATMELGDLELAAFHCALYGNGYLRIERDGTGAPYGLTAVPTWRVAVETTAAGAVWYRVASDTALGEAEAMVPADNMVHIRYRTIGPNRLLGVPPVAACAPAFAQALQSRVVQQTLWRNLTTPGGVLTSPGKIDPLVAKKLQQDWEKNYSAGGAGRAAVLSNGLKYEPIIINGVDSQLLESIQASTQDIANAYGIPLQFLSSAEHLTFASAQEGTRALIVQALRPFTARIADAIALKLLSRGELATGSGVSFDLTSLLLLPGTELADYVSKLVNGGVLSPNEARNTFLGLPDVKGGDALRAPVNTSPIDRWLVGAVGQQPPATAALREVEARTALAEIELRQTQAYVQRMEAETVCEAARTRSSEAETASTLAALRLREVEAEMFGDSDD